MTSNPIDQVRRLRQSATTWLCTARRAPTWIMPKDKPPYRPYVVLVLEQASNRIRQTRILDKQPTPEAVLDVLVKAMLSSLPQKLLGLGCSRPRQILIDDADLAQALAPRLAEVDVLCEYRPTLAQINAALREMEAYMTKREPIPGLLSLPGATQPLVGEFYAASAEYYRQAPWQRMDNWDPIEVRYPSEGRTRYALVLGSGGETFGLSLYESLEDVRLATLSTGAAGRISWFSLVFEEATSMAFDDLDAIEKYGWPIAGEQAYPLAIKAIPPDKWGVPNASELACLAATARAMPDFVQAGRGEPRPAQVTYPLSGVYGNQTISLRYPAEALFEMEDEDGDSLLGATDSESEEYDSAQALEDFIQDWYWDEPSHELARQMGAFLFEFVDHLETSGLSGKTVQKHLDNCWLIGKFECDYGYHKTFSPEILLGGPAYLYEFKRKVSDAKSAIASYKSTWRKLDRYVRSLGYGSNDEDEARDNGERF